MRREERALGEVGATRPRGLLGSRAGDVGRVLRELLGGGVHPQLEPREAGEAHLRAQQQPPAGLDRLHPPEVQRVVHAQVPLVAAAPAQPRSAGEPVHEATDLPRERPRVPAPVATDLLDDLPQHVGGGVHDRPALVDVERPARPVGVGRQRVARRAREGRRRPPGGDLAVVDALQRQPDRPLHADEPLGRVGHEGADVVLAAHRLVLEGLDERLRDPGGDGCHEPDPEAGQARGEDGDRDDDPAREPGDPGVRLHQLAVRQDVGATDVERARDVRGHVRAADEVAQHVADRDRLDPVRHPARRRHDGQPFREIAHHLERGRARAQDHRGLEHRRRDPGGEQDLADLAPARQVPRQLHARRREPAQVDQAPDPGLAGGPSERAREVPVPRLEVAPGAEGVDQVVGHVDAVERGAQLVGVPHVAPDELDVVRPLAPRQACRVARERADAEAGGEELGDEPAAHVARDPGHGGEPGHRRAVG